MEPKYKPLPIDTSGIEIEDQISILAEVLAEHAHDIWAAQRFQDGWTFGSNRCDERKHHPCLVPYSALPESEKQYDRNAAIGTIKAIVALGYKIEKV